MNQHEFEAVIRQPAAKRYEYFIKKTADYEEVWGLYNEGWATAQDDLGNTLLPFFPNEKFAETFAKKEWEGFSPKRIELDHFLEKWLPGMKSDGVKPSIFPTDTDSALIDVDTLMEDLAAELEKY
ncbi:DUF2750 domain-containing protein [Mesobacillus selenatarsenatis]|uniref:DUF2750 domain-containing protein n=1 Tax=Mesobacillus selenatarsenatis (strain DSM 18680 / JCM 14380 / FERM P-15431 / SF-1) TaxID=1321606 RepID=A0A0A8X9P3_MESS1|nr:DUF2750 domain-containing protein [Mesobacillus selenatarsenatis]GAM14856.1 hypothetical protein SAMD00020551_3010 [Mesobacillus selenatarsenatis SF-1]